MATIFSQKEVGSSRVSLMVDTEAGRHQRAEHSADSPEPLKDAIDESGAKMASETTHSATMSWA